MVPPPSDVVHPMLAGYEGYVEFAPSEVEQDGLVDWDGRWEENLVGDK